ncbi:hypothetical protein POM88_006785 [Heracleum sosnowskyi]|uniref:Uncharacterized protein n=1 Tax=Heracleum sosnowskyi TaxID=360622 RepID=A0AAD8J3C2_9APIA|nr:hypothetical protein POM88_006785 [Heracleum sosnowskyi]
MKQPERQGTYQQHYIEDIKEELIKCYSSMNQTSCTRKRPLETDVGGSAESQKGVPTPSAANKEGSQTEPTVVPLEPKKKRAKRTKTTVNHPAVSQKTVEENKAVNSSLDVPSQQGASIEIGLSPKAPCTESAQPHVLTHEEPPLAETHMESGHSEDFTSQIDASQVPSVEQSLFSSPLSPSSFPTHSFVYSPQPREGDSPNPSGFDHPSSIMDEPPSGPQEPISQSEMDTTPSNTEKEQGATLLERETTSALFNLQGASYLREDAVKDSANVVVTGDPAVKDSVEPDFDVVTVEDVSDDDVPLSQFLKVHSKPSLSLHVSTAHTHASRLSEDVQKKREIKEKIGEHKNERQPNELAKGGGLEHVQSELEGALHFQALSLKSSSMRSDEITQKNPESVRTPTASNPHFIPSPPRRLRTGGPSTAMRLEALEHRCHSMETKLDSLYTMAASGFSSIQEAIQVLYANIAPANLPKGEKREKSESVPKQDVATQGEPVSKEESRSKGESVAKRESVSAKKKRGEKGNSGRKGDQEAGNLFEYEMAGEKPTSNPNESALEKKWREQEEQNRLGKRKDKLPEYILLGNIWSEGTEFSQEEANALMVDYMESTLHNHDDDFSRIVEEAMLEPSRRLNNCSTLLKEKIINVCVKINEEKRWAIDVYLNNGISMFITMQLLQNLPAKVLTVMKNKIKANHTSFNEILQLLMLSLISEKLPEVYTNPFCVYYETTARDGKRRYSYMSLGGTSTMESKAILKVLDMILNSKANKERALAIKAIHKFLVKRDKELSSTVKMMISKANSKRADQGESCSYDVSFDDDDELDGSGGTRVAGNASGRTSGNVGTKSQDINAEKDNITKEVVIEDTVLKEAVMKEAVTEDTVKEDIVMEDTVNEDAVKDEIKPTVKPKRTKSLARAWFSRQEPEPEETTKARKGKTKYSGKEKATGLCRNLKKPLQIKYPNSLEVQYAKSKEIRSAEVVLDANQEASIYILWWDSSRRRIDYFLDRMVELLQSYDNVPNKVMEHVLKYQDERDMEFYQKFGMFEDHDDSDIAHLLEYSDEEIAD